MEDYDFKGYDLEVLTKYDDDGNPTIQYISWDELKEKLGERYDEFGEWMYGQTCLLDGAYPWDVQRFIHGLPIID